jgi:CO/xanthine dehydrogenase Mo-binding subunit
VADLLKVPKQNVRLIYHESSGCYGRLGVDDVSEDAALMSRAVGKPVRVQWMREDEHGWEPKGPAQLLTVRAGMDAEGKVVAWDYMDRSFCWTEAGNPLLPSRQIGMKTTVPGNTNGTGAAGEIYRFDNQKMLFAAIPWVQPEPTPLRTGALRAPGELARCFATESFMDEIAASLKVDPVQLRLRYLAGQRAKDVLLAAARQAKWEERPSPSSASGSKLVGRGVAVSERSDTVVAVVAEVEVDKSTGAVAVRRVTVAHDCGLIVNPDGLKNQIEGNVIQGVSRLLMEEVQYDSARITSLDWKTYPILTFEGVPEVDIVLINRPGMETLGGGEPSISPVPPAIANAVFDAIGVRLRQVPFTPARVLSSLRSAQAVDQPA